MIRWVSGATNEFDIFTKNLGGLDSRSTPRSLWEKVTMNESEVRHMSK